MDRTRNGGEQPADIHHTDQPRMPVTPWIARDPIPYAVKEALIRRAAAERTAFIQHVVAAPFRTLRRLAHTPPAAAERSSGLLGPDHDRILREAGLDRERARGELLANVFALPALILGRRRPASSRRLTETEKASAPPPATEQIDETL